jgi:hypothetical protein
MEPSRGLAAEHRTRGCQFQGRSESPECCWVSVWGNTRPFT